MRKRKVPSPRCEARRPRPSAPPGGAGRSGWLYGRHAVKAALQNPRRRVRRLVATADGLAALGDAVRRDAYPVAVVERQELDRLLGPGTVHQGVAAEADPLPAPRLADACAPRPGAANLVLALDQVTDPHNVGAILRSAAAFGARAVVVTERHSPPADGALAKAASGALEAVPLVRVVNLARALAELKGLGYWCLLLDPRGERDLAAARMGPNVALVLGSEGAGARRLVRETCDLAVRLPTGPGVESLNVSVAAGVALYALARGGGAR